MIVEFLVDINSKILKGTHKKVTPAIANQLVANKQAKICVSSDNSEEMTKNA